MGSGVKSFLSGCEVQHHHDAAVAAGAEYILMSYLYATKGGTNLFAVRKAKDPQLKFMMDSGAHTLQGSMHKAPYNTWTQADLEKYVRGYVDFIDRNRHCFFAVVELDVAYSVNHIAGKQPNDPYGDTIVDNWRKNYFMPLQQSGVNVIYVWHPSQGHQGWEDLCANFPYVGLPGENSSSQDFNTYMTVAKRYMTKVHGFAATKQSDYRDHAWYSVDSTSWKAGEIYGTLPVWNERQQKLRFLKVGERDWCRQIFMEQGVDPDKVILGTDYKEVTRSALKSMIGMELFYRERYKSRKFYYELRLPTPALVAKEFSICARWAWETKFEAERCFPQHAAETSKTAILEYLQAISCVQYRDLASLTANGRNFLQEYFPTLMGAQTIDTLALAKEMCILISPTNVEAIRREILEDFDDSNNPARRRTDDPFDWNDSGDDLLLEQLIHQQQEKENAHRN